MTKDYNLKKKKLNMKKKGKDIRFSGRLNKIG